MQAPRIETPRTLLRAPSQADFEPFSVMWADPEVTRFIGGKPFSRNENWTRFLRMSGLWAILGYGYWSIEDKAGRYIGTVGFADFMRGIPEIERIPEAGWALVPDTHGQGLASEVVGAIVGWADAQLGAPQTCCIIDPGHDASFRVAEKNGFVVEGLVDYDDGQTTVFKRARR